MKNASYVPTLLLLGIVFFFGQTSPAGTPTSASASVSFPSSRTQALSPDKRFRVFNVNNTSEPYHTVFLEDRVSHAKRKLLDYDREVEVLWNPDSRSFALTDYTGSNISQCLLFRTAPDSSPVNIWDKILGGVKDEKERAMLLNNDHVYIAAIRWVNRHNLKVKVWGHGDASPEGFTRSYAYTIQRPATEPASNRTIPCKTPANAASCYWTHGRLGFYNGTPAFRLWKVGTHRLLGIYSGPSVERYGEDNEHPEFPANMQRIFKPNENRIFADFEVCPLEPEQGGAMQPACIESAKNIVVER